MIKHELDKRLIVLVSLTALMSVLCTSLFIKNSTHNSNLIKKYKSDSTIEYYINNKLMTCNDIKIDGILYKSDSYYNVSAFSNIKFSKCESIEITNTTKSILIKGYGTELFFYENNYCILKSSYYYHRNFFNEYTCINKYSWVCDTGDIFNEIITYYNSII